MRCLTSSECSEWLQRQDISPAPYGNPIPKGISYLQFAPPVPRDNLKAFTHDLFKAWGNYQGGLLQVTEWAFDPEYEIDPTSELRLAHGEQRWLIDAPGHLFEAGEELKAENLINLVLDRRWTAYWYPTSKTVTALIWDGELIDFWSRDVGAIVNTYAELLRYKARIVHRRVGWYLSFRFAALGLIQAAH